MRRRRRRCRRFLIGLRNRQARRSKVKDVARLGVSGVVASWDREEKKKKPGRLPLILIGVFAIACLVALLFLGDLARYQEAGMVVESQATLRDVNDYQQLDQAQIGRAHV